MVGGRVLIAVIADAAAGENPFEVTEEFQASIAIRYSAAVNGAILYHQDLAVAVDDLRFDFADLLVA